MTVETRRAVQNGLQWLAARQQPDGSFGGREGYAQNVGVAGLAGMAFLASGSTPDRGPYGRHVTAVVDFLLARTQPDGYIISGEKNRSHGPMYGHGFATLFLAEAYGMLERDDFRPRLSKAVQLIVNSQNDDGGWRYTPQSRAADISVTVCQMMALRAARNAGFAVPRETVDRCLTYLRKCRNDDGGYRYQLEAPRDSLFPRSAAALVGFYSAGVYSGPEIDAGLDYVSGFQPLGDRRVATHFFYGHYYAVQAMRHAGDKRWPQWYGGLRDELIRVQETDGHWKDRLPSMGSVYATAMACLILQVPNGLLPIFQR